VKPINATAQNKNQHAIFVPFGNSSHSLNTEKINQIKLMAAQMGLSMGRFVAHVLTLSLESIQGGKNK